MRKTEDKIPLEIWRGGAAETWRRASELVCSAMDDDQRELQRRSEREKKASQGEKTLCFWLRLKEVRESDTGNGENIPEASKNDK